MNLKLTNNKQSGFTLVELLVVIAILGVLTMISVTNFMNSQLRARDAKRKSDLGQIQRALEMYLNDHGSYPPSTAAGLISAGNTTFAWGDEFKDSSNTTYIKQLPADPRATQSYCYFLDLTNGCYKLYAKLENLQDPKIGNYTCATVSYNYGVSGSNCSP